MQQTRLLILIVAVLLVWWIIPDILTSIRSKHAKRDELATTQLKRQVTKHEEAIEAELNPVVEAWSFSTRP